MNKKYNVGITESDWVEVAASEFMMGSPESEKGREEDERLHSVQVDGFKMLKTPVTFSMFDTYCDETGRTKISDNDWGRGNLPVINVSYWDAVDYCEWLRVKMNWSVRLPTEAEWEYACRAGTTTSFWFGDSVNVEQANCDGPHTYDPECRGKTSPVGSYPSNSWGLYDSHGNVWEWCASSYNESYGGLELLDASSERSNGASRVLRGGSVYFDPLTLRSASRHPLGPSEAFNTVGFRLVRD